MILKKHTTGRRLNTELIAICVLVMVFAVAAACRYGMLAAEASPGLPSEAGQGESESEAADIQNSGSADEAGIIQQDEPQSGAAPSQHSEPQSETGSAQHSEPEGETGSAQQGEPQSETGTAQQNEPGSESEPESEIESESESETEEVKWPQGHYIVKITDAAVQVPADGRVYDGTDRIDVSFSARAELTAEDAQGSDRRGRKLTEEIPGYEVQCTSRLDSPDAGERRVICSFILKTEYPENIRLDETTAAPDLKVTVKRAVLSVRLPNGKKKYGEPADMEHIRLDDEQGVIVSGFVRDGTGREVIPADFVPPSVDIDPSVIQQFSPIYDTEHFAATGDVCVREYKNALMLKRDQAGEICGNPTLNYEFCRDPADERYDGGSVTIERAPLRKHKSYELKGEKGAYIEDGRGNIIVRAGTYLQAVPAADSGYNTGAEITDIRSDGTFSFRLEMRTPQGILAADSEEESVRFRQDREAPEAILKTDGAAQSGGVMFSSSSASVSVDSPEDDVSGLESVRYRLMYCPISADTVQASLAGAAPLSDSSGWRTISSGGRVSLNQDGIYAVEAETRDRVGNTHVSKGRTIVIDRLEPEIEIYGVEDGSANSSMLHIRAECHDPSFLPGSLKSELSADFGGVQPSSSESPVSDGATLTFGDFPHRREADAQYHLRVTASDRAGNESRKSVSFSVNRFGSAYGLSEDTAAGIRKFYHKEPFDVTYVETNLDKVGDARVLLRSADALTELRQGSGLEVWEGAVESGVRHYTYTVPASRFTDDGTYEVMLLTTDRAGNSSDSSAQRLPVRFAIDATDPECLITGLKPEGRYKEESLTAVIEVRDNLALQDAQVYLDARKLMDQTARELARDGGVIKITLPEKEAWQTVQVHVRDKAGNQMWTKEIPVFISSHDPEKAEAFVKSRLSAQQTELLMGYLQKARNYVMKSAFFSSAVHNTGQGRAVNLPVMSGKITGNSLSTRGKPEGSTGSQLSEGKEKSLVFPIVTASLTIAASLAGAGIVMYRRKLKPETMRSGYVRSWYARDDKKEWPKELER